MQFAVFQRLSYQTSEPEPPIEVLVGIPEEQVSGSLRFILLLKNQTESEISVDNPADFVTYTLIDSEGWPRNLAARNTRGKVHRSSKKAANRSPYITHVNTSVAQSNEEQDFSAPEPVILLTPRTEIRQLLSIEGIRSSHDSNDVMPVAPGHYRIDFLLPFRWTEEADRHQINLQSEVLDVDLS
ncbi:MAG: hypothetical protein O2890_01765 [Cyanobacteria bacterium]|nr:hypothetical protein [Cyanobacteriota bacterium]MDA0865146.1 hypothetical protein [Cyanobacteriota bacterium]